MSIASGAGDVTTWTYGAANQLLTETTYPNGTGAAGDTTRYVYDSHDHLRFVITPMGEVTRYAARERPLRGPRARSDARSHCGARARCRANCTSRTA